MNYTLNDLIGFIARHDEHEDYYREQLEALIREREAEAWSDGYLAGGATLPATNLYRKAVQS